jgi:hypothetical protein
MEGTVQPRRNRIMTIVTMHDRNSDVIDCLSERLEDGQVIRDTSWTSSTHRDPHES